MLKRTNQNAKFCYESAARAAQKAANAHTPSDRDFWLDRERHWIHLGASYDYQERLSNFIEELRTLPRRPICTACDVPMRVTRLHYRPGGLVEFNYECPACEAKQTVVEIDVKPTSA
jgi:hypothetical protein